MSITNDTVDAPIKLLNLPDLACVNTIQELISLLPSYLVASIPTSITNVVIGNIQPLDTQRNTIWFRKDNAGNFIGIYVFSAGVWAPMYPVSNQIFPRWRVSSDPVTEPVGFTRLDNTPGVPASVVTARMADWVADGLNPGYFLYYEVCFTGF